MPAYTVETTRHLPAFRHRTYHAATPAEACCLAIADEDWENEVLDPETAGENYITGIWRGADAAYRGEAEPVPSHFEETVQRKADHFETLFGLLKMLAANARAGRLTADDWLARADWAVARCEAILSGARDPDCPPEPPAPIFLVAELHADRVRDYIADLIAVDGEFADLSPDAVTDEDIRASCSAEIASLDFAEEIGAAAFRAAIAALRTAMQRQGGEDG